MEIRFEECTNLKEVPVEVPPFGHSFTDYMFIMDYEEGLGWHDARLVPYGNLDMSPSSFVLHYSQTIFEGLKAYNQVNGAKVLFRAQDNFKRFNASAARLAMPQIDEEFVFKALKFHLGKELRWFYNDVDSSIYIRPFMYGSEDYLGVKIVKKYRYVVIMCPVGKYFSGTVKLKCEENYARSVAGGVGQAKTGGNYAASLLATKEAQVEGFDQVLWLDGVNKRYVEEAGVMNIFFVIDNVVVTPQLTGTILAGITRASALTYLNDLGYDTSEDLIDINVLVAMYLEGRVQEVFATGTAATIMPVSLLQYKDQSMNFTYNEESVASILDVHFRNVRLGILEDKHGYIIPFM